MIALASETLVCSSSESSAGDFPPRASNSASRCRWSGNPATPEPIHCRTFPAQMQHQVAGGVFVFPAPHPDLLGRQACQAVLNMAVQLIELVGRKAEEDFFGRHKTSSAQFSRMDLTFPVN